MLIFPCFLAIFTPALGSKPISTSYCDSLLSRNPIDVDPLGPASYMFRLFVPVLSVGLLS